MSKEKSERTKIDWQSMPIVIDQADPNPLNPYAAVSPEEREQALSDVARRILLRKVKTIASN